MIDRRWQKGQILQFLGCKHADGSFATKGSGDFIDQFKPGDVVRVHSVNPLPQAMYPYTVFSVDFDPLSLDEEESYGEPCVRESELGELNLGNIEDYM